MRTFIWSALLALGPLFAFAQPKAIAQFYEKYKQQEHVTDVKLQGWLLEIASSFADDEQAKKILDKITYLRVLVMEEGNLVSASEYKNLLKDIRQSSFEELLKIREGQQDIGFYIREKGDTITDVLLLVNGESQFVLLSLEGLLKFSDLNDLHIDIDGAEHFERLPEKKGDVPRA
ncbi:MAG: DUF4252 domain-containing protein [Lewinellaceae bacterium]|nr:DUF4252 domain-containing protein [Phaeodactylibacter sp.]MCB9042122.1 DUF4252 domain-containing protein [Lewinellaceae bacterium]